MLLESILVVPCPCTITLVSNSGYGSSELLPYLCQLIMFTVSLGNKRTWLAGSLQYLSLYGVSTAYVITTATCLRYYSHVKWEDYYLYAIMNLCCSLLLVSSVAFLSHVILQVLVYLNDIYVHFLTMLGLSTKCRAILKSNCYHKEGHQAPCKYGDVVYMMLFGLVQVIMSFIPDLHNMAWVSIVAAIMSFTYSSIGLGLGITTVIGKVHFHN